MVNLMQKVFKRHSPFPTAKMPLLPVAAHSIRVLFVRWRNRSSPDSFVLFVYGKRQDGNRYRMQLSILRL